MNLPELGSADRADLVSDPRACSPCPLCAFAPARGGCSRGISGRLKLARLSADGTVYRQKRILKKRTLLLLLLLRGAAATLRRSRTVGGRPAYQAGTAPPHSPPYRAESWTDDSFPPLNIRISFRLGR